MRAKQEYEILLKSGDLLDIFPYLSGDWSKDKKTFEKDYNEYIKILNDIDVDYEDYDEGLLENESY